jgi:hypothetical protein
MRTPAGLYIDNPAFPLLQAYISYWGITDGLGAVTGTTIVCNDLANEPSYAGHQVKLLTGPSAGQSSRIDTHIGNTLTVPWAFTDATGVATQVVAGTIFVILTESWGLDIAALIALLVGALSPTRSLLETWQDVLGINPNIWTVTNPAIPWAAPTEVGGFLYAQTTLVLNEVARLRSVQQWVEYPNSSNLNLIVKKTILEWEMMLGVPANLDNTVCIWGFTNGPNDTRITPNLIGFGLLGGVLQAITDLGGLEVSTPVPAANLALHNKFRVEIYANTADWYFNEALVATTAIRIPVNPMYIQFLFDTTGAGGCAVDIGIVRCWYEMVVT